MYNPTPNFLPESYNSSIMLFYSTVKGGPLLCSVLGLEDAIYCFIIRDAIVVISSCNPSELLVKPNPFVSSQLWFNYHSK